jgi:hypothetical protein
MRAYKESRMASNIVPAYTILLSQFTPICPNMMYLNNKYTLGTANMAFPLKNKNPPFIAV